MNDEMNVLMIVSDTFRGDHLGINKGPADTPNLDELARQSVRFSRYQIASFPTVPARFDFLVGKYSFVSTGWGHLPSSEVTVPRLIQTDPPAIVTAGVADTPYYSTYGYRRDFQGFRQFDIPRWQPTLRPGPDVFRTPRKSEYDNAAPQTMTHAEKLLERLADHRFFLLVDTLDPHEPWDPPAYYAKRYKADYVENVVHPPYGPCNEFGVSETELANAHAAYCATITMVDRWIGRLLERLESLDLAERTAVIFVSDHGFYFGEHGGLLGKMVRTSKRFYDDPERFYEWKRSPLYPEVIHVPLLIRIPGQAPTVVERLVSAIDLAPTILDLFDVERPEYMHGRSMLGLLGSDDAPTREVAVSATPLATPGEEVRVVDDVTRYIADWQPISVSDGKHLMLFSRWDDPIELYDLSADSACERNIASERQDVVKELHDKLIAELELAGAREEDIAVRS